MVAPYWQAVMETRCQGSQRLLLATKIDVLYEPYRATKSFDYGMYYGLEEEDCHFPLSHYTAQ